MTTRRFMPTSHCCPDPSIWVNYEVLLELTDYPTWFVNSVLVATGTVCITLVISVLIAYSVTRLQFRGKMAVVGTMLYAYMFPPLLLAIPLFSLFVKLGIDDTRLSLMISHCTITLPLGVWLAMGVLQADPDGRRGGGHGRWLLPPEGFRACRLAADLARGAHGGDFLIPVVLDRLHISPWS